MKPFNPRRSQRGTAMIEAALCFAVFAPIAFTAVRLGYGVNQVHEAQAAVAAAGKLATTCASDEAIRKAAIAEAPGVQPSDVQIERLTEGDRQMVRVTLSNIQIQRLGGAERLEPGPSAEFPDFCR